MDTTYAILLVNIVATIILNSIVIVSFLKAKEELKIREKLLLSLAIANTLQCSIGYSIELYFSFSKRFGQIECQIGGFTSAFLALVSITHLMALSVERYYSLLQPFRASLWNLRRAAVSMYFLIPIWSYGLMWALFPLVGWSGYAPIVKNTTLCTTDLLDRSYKSLTYSYALLIFCYVIPISIMAICFKKVKDELARMRRSAETSTGRASHLSYESRRNENATAIMILVMVMAFFIAWTPYAVIILYITITQNVPTNLLLAAMMLGKSSTMYNPIIYVLLYKRFRDRIKKIFLSCTSTSGNIFEKELLSSGNGNA